MRPQREARDQPRAQTGAGLLVLVCIHPCLLRSISVSFTSDLLGVVFYLSLVFCLSLAYRVGLAVCNNYIGSWWALLL